MKHILVITYYWPPAGGIQSYRITNFVNFLHKLGWKITLYIPQNPSYPFVDPYLPSNEANFTILKQPIWEPLSIFQRLTGRKKEYAANNALHIRDKEPGLLARAAKWIRANFFIPDARSMWIRPSVAFLEKYLSTNKINCILNTAPPHSTTVIGLQLKARTGIPWVSDWRDPWTQVDYFKEFPFSKKALLKHQFLEREALKHSDLLVTVSEGWKRDLENIGAKNVNVIYSGYDPDQYRLLSDRSNPDSLVITHAGSLGRDRDPKALLIALKHLKEESEFFSNHFRLNLVGTIDHTIRHHIEELNLTKQVVCYPYLPKKEVLELLRASNCGLIIQNEAENVKGRIPGKVFELMAMRKLTLCLGEMQSDLARILSDCQLGTTCEKNNVQQIKVVLRKLPKDLKTFKPNLGELEKYEIENQVRKLDRELGKIILK